MNTASRMESTGLRDKIQISQETADLLIAAGKSSWITPREETVVAKGKGEMCTFWLTIGTSASGRSEAPSDHSDGAGMTHDAYALKGTDQPVEMSSVSAKAARLIQWNVEILYNLLRQVEAHREPLQPDEELPPVNEEIEDSLTVLEEVKEIIHLPSYEKTRAIRDPDKIEFSRAVHEQLHEYVAAVASMYRGKIRRTGIQQRFESMLNLTLSICVVSDNPFHNFEHASHVTLSVVKLMSRIVAPDLVTTKEELKSSLHDHTYGITSDPLTQFACVFSALIHDVDHTGVPNSQLLNENAKLALYYKERSVAEQNSVDLSWDLLMDDNFKDLRAVIYRTDEERKRFRELVVNSVMATDIMDKDLKKLRNARWEKAFSGTHLESEKDAFDRKATIVIEHLIQASDISHTMQHWHIYRKWNTRLFEEMHRAYVEGRADKCPADFWYQGEIGFFDFYIIPLAKKLKDCGVFGVSCDEYLNYAMKNRQEWEERGQEIVAEMAQAVVTQSRADP
jgi:3'5'-cyclic nucleotide phosphodiesterase/Adenylate and Guanylate cyclase catalytic domain